MAGTRYVITIEATTGSVAQTLSATPDDKSKSTRALGNLIQGIGAGVYRAGRVEIQWGAGNGGTAAAQTVTYASSTGAQSLTIGGTTVNFTAGASDAVTVQNAIAAIRANNTVFGLVFIPTAPVYGASINTAAVLTLWANTVPTANTLGNSLAITGTGTGATVGGATFTGGVNATRSGFNV
jgi:hypothetical protein